MAELLLAKGNHYIQMWIAPHGSILDDAQRSRARLFALLALLSSCATLLTLLFLIVIRYPLEIGDFAILPAAAVIVAVSRSRWYRFGMLLGIVTNYAWVITTILNSDNRDYATLLLMMPVVIVSLLFSTWATVVAALVSVAISVIIGRTSEGWTDVLSFTALFIFMISIGIVIATALRERDNRKLVVRASALQTSESRYRALFHQSPIPLSEEDFTAMYLIVKRLEAQGVSDIEAYFYAHGEVVEEIFRQLEVVEVNPATLALYHAKSVEEFTPYFASKYFERNSAVLAQSIAAMWRGDVEHTYEAVDYTLDGEPFECRIRWVRLSNHPLRIVVSIEDLTPIKEADRQQQQLAAERARADMLQRFLGDATHDLLTPITIMNTSIYLGLRSDDLDHVHQRLHTIQAQATYLHMMITDMLTMSRLDDPTTPFHFHVDDLTPHIARIVSEFEPLAQTKEQEIRFQSEGDTGRVRYDEPTMGRALKNLIQNAHKYTPQNGTITVRTRCKDRYFAIDVSDTGVGIPQEELTHIFDRFYRVEAHRPIDGGSGLGLAIVKKIVDAHSGQIDVRSSPSSGTTFTIRLPLANEVIS